VQSQDDLTAFVRWALEHPDERDAMGQRAAAVIASGRGATETTCQRLLGLLPPPAAA